MTTVGILQPNYLPWIGNFDLMAQTDVWVWYDDVQYTRRDWRNRNRVAGKAQPVWLTVPVRHAQRSALRICDALIDADREWVRRHLETVRHFYGRAPFFLETLALLRRTLDRPHERLTDLAIELNESLAEALEIRPRFVRSSQLTYPRDERNGRLLAICQQFDATTYLSGPAARAYLEPDRFARQGIAIRYASYDYPQYDRGGGPFYRDLSVIDPLCWAGAAQVARWLGRRDEARSLEAAPASA